MAKDRIIINVKGRVGVGKSGVCEIIRRALQEAYGENGDVVIEASELDQDIRQLGTEGLHHPHPDKVEFVITEELMPR